MSLLSPKVLLVDMMDELRNAEMSPTVSIYRLFVSSVTFEQLCIRSHHEDAYMCQNNLD